MCSEIFLDEKGGDQIWQRKTISFGHPLISYGGIYDCKREYVEERDGKKREYAPKIMVATST